MAVIASSATERLRRSSRPRPPATRLPSLRSSTRNHEDMRRVCVVVAGDEGIAEDAVAAAWSIAWRKLGSLRDPARLRPWLVSVAVNEARQLLRARKRRSLIEVPVIQAGEPWAASTRGRRSTPIDLRNALARLDPVIGRFWRCATWRASMRPSSRMRPGEAHPARGRDWRASSTDWKRSSAMNELNGFERRLAAGLEAYAGPRRSVDADAIVRAATSRLPLRRSILLRFMAVVTPLPRAASRRVALVALLAVLALALAAGAVMVGNQPRRLPAVVRAPRQRPDRLCPCRGHLCRRPDHPIDHGDCQRPGARLGPHLLARWIPHRVCARSSLDSGRSTHGRSSRRGRRAGHRSGGFQ